MKFDKNTVALDADGVQLNFDLGFRITASKALGRELELLNPRAYSMRERYGMTPKENATAWEAMMTEPAGWRGLPALEGAKEAVDALKKAGKRIIVVTKIPSDVVDLRAENLKKLGLHFDDIVVTKMGNNCKTEALSKIKPALFVDDRLDLVRKASFVPDKFWIDLGHEQDEGHENADETVGYSNSLAGAITQWAPSQGFHFSYRKKIVHKIKM